MWLAPARSLWRRFVVSLSLSVCVLGCGSRSDSAGPVPDSGGMPILTPFSSATGTERLQFARWHEQAGTRDCDLHWTVAAAPAAGCPTCAYGFSVRATLDEAASTDDGTCADIHVDRERILAYTTDWEGLGPTVVTQEEDQWYWWGYAEASDAGLRWWFGWEDLDPPGPTDGPDTHEGLWLTNRWDAELAFP